MSKEMDLLSLMKIIISKRKFILMFMLISAILTFFYSRVCIPPKYSSSVRLYVENKSQTTPSLTEGDLTAARSIAATSSIIFTGENVLERVVSDPKVRYTEKELKKMLNVTSVNDTEIMELTVECYDPDDAAYIVSAVSDTCIAEYNRIIKSGNIVGVTKARVNKIPSSPNIILNTVLGLIIGLFISCLIVLIKAFYDNTIKSIDDIGKIYNIPVFAEIVDFEKFAEQKNYNYY